jgi:hypothetical protein
LPIDSRYVAHVVANRSAFRRLVGQSGVLGAAFSRYSMEDDVPRVDSRAFFINGAVFSKRNWVRYDTESRRITVRHELAHLALSTYTRPFTPPWLREGAAVFFSEHINFDMNRALVARDINRFSLPRLTTARSLGEHDSQGAQTADEYLFSGNAVAFLVDSFGVESFLEFYRSYAGVSEESARQAMQESQGLSRMLTNTSSQLTTSLTQAALERHFQMTLQELDRELKESLWLRYR